MWWIASIGIAVTVGAPPTSAAARLMDRALPAKRTTPPTPKPGRDRPDPNALPPGFSPLPKRSSPRSIADFSDRELLEGLSTWSWIADPRPDDSPLAPRCPYHHPSVTWLVQRALSNAQARDEIVGELRKALQSRLDGERRFAAAVGLTLLGDVSGLAELNQRLLDARKPESSRAAAAFALAAMPQRLDRAALARLFDRWCPDQSNSESDPTGTSRQNPPRLPLGRPRESASLATGVLLALVRAQLADPAYDPAADIRIARAVKDSQPSLRRIAALAHAGRAWQTVPPTLNALGADSEPIVRMAAAAALAAHPTGAGRELVLRASNDRDPAVRAAAVALLGGFPDADRQVTERLRAALRGDSPNERSAAVRAAARLRTGTLVLESIVDAAAKVRKTAAEALGEFDPAVASAGLRTLANDRSPEVQQAAIRSIARFPQPEAAPMLLEAMESPSLAARRVAADGLGKFLGAADLFPADAPAPERQAAIDSLRRQLAIAAPPRAGGPAASVRSTDAVAAAQIMAADQWLHTWHSASALERRALAEQLAASKPASLPAIEAALERRRSFPDAELTETVLGRLDTIYARLAEWRTADSRAEPSVTARLAAELRQRHLSAVQAAAMADRLSQCESSAVWQLLAPLIARDSASAKSLLCERGLRHPQPAIRQWACEQFDRQSGSDAERLIALLRDDDPAVRTAAIGAIGRLRDPSLAARLQPALTDKAPRIRLAAAASLAQLGRPEGLRELQRLLHDPEWSVRRSVARSLAEPGGDPEQNRSLLLAALADERLEVRKEAVASLEKLTGASFASDTDGKAIPFADQIGKWRKSMPAPAAIRDRRAAN